VLEHFASSVPIEGSFADGPAPAAATTGPTGELPIPTGLLVVLRLRRCDPDVAVLEVSGEVDAPEADLIRTQVLALLDGSGCVVLDLCGVGFLGARGLTALMVVHERAASIGRRLVVVTGINKRVLRPIQVCGLEQVLVLARVVDEIAAPSAP
jgi:anti-anti-sigma factor